MQIIPKASKLYRKIRHNQRLLKPLLRTTKELLFKGHPNTAMLIARYPLRFVNSDNGLTFTNQAKLLIRLRGTKCASEEAKQKDIARQCKVYVINLEKSTDRIKRFKRNASLNNLSFTRFEAVDLRKEKIESYSDILGKDFNGNTEFPLGTTGCFLSH